MLFEQLALADVLQVDPYEVDLVVRKGRVGGLVRELRRVELLADSLLVEGLRLLFLEKPMGLNRDVILFKRVRLIVDGHEPVVLGTLSPIKYVRLVGRITPIHQRLAALRWTER
ncbi:MAG TPA: hypothetical protein VGQ10_19410 [Vicinamibacterales bacterium]|nr:hypothetical protein [Vicinamibacterales bacterium]